MKDKIKLLIVEDQDKHIEDAQKYLLCPSRAKIVEPTFCRTLSEFHDEISGKQYSGVITDMFFPLGYEGTKKQDLITSLGLTLANSVDVRSPSIDLYLSEMEAWRLGKVLPPAGIRSTIDATEKGVPVVINTAAYHHAHAFELIWKWRGDESKDIFGNPLKIVETGTYNSHMSCENNFKDWKTAYALIMLDVARKHRQFDFCGVGNFLARHKKDEDKFYHMAGVFDYYKNQQLDSMRPHEIQILEVLKRSRETYSVD